MAIFAPNGMDISIEHALNLLNLGKITLQGEFVWGSNYTFLVNLEFNGDKGAGVYKPTRGERPLWDFPPASLAKREVAAFLVSEALGWRFVPPTVLRKNGPLGPGSLQLYIEHDPEYHYFNFSHDDLERLKPVAIFDMLINNADRKGSRGEGTYQLNCRMKAFLGRLPERSFFETRCDSY